jgi:hypothetical protein
MTAHNETHYFNSVVDKEISTFCRMFILNNLITRLNKDMEQEMWIVIATSYLF